jgi:FkbM family methyltransferase
MFPALAEQIGQQMDDGLRIRIGAHDFVVACKANAWFWRRFEKGAWEPETFVILERFIDPSRSYLDIGCWIGPTLFYGCQFARVACGVEADPYAYAELSENVARNHSRLHNVTIHNICLAKSTGSVRLGTRSRPGDSMSSILFGDAPQSWTAHGLHFADLLERFQISDCAFIKMDIEGGEYTLIPAMVPRLLATRPTLYLSLHPRLFLLSKLERNGRLARGLSDLTSRKAKRRRHSTLARGATHAVLKVFAFLTTCCLLAPLRQYTYLYDATGRRLTYRRLFAISNGTMAIVITDISWHKDSSGN